MLRWEISAKKHRDDISVTNVQGKMAFRREICGKPRKAAERWQKATLLWTFWEEMQLRGGWAGVLCSAVSQRGLDFCRRHRDPE